MAVYTPLVWQPLGVPVFWVNLRHDGFVCRFELAACLCGHVPFGVSQYWLAENRFDYAQTGGYLGYSPTAMLQFPAALQLSDNVQTADTAADLHQFALATNTQFIVAGPGTSPGLSTALAQWHWKMQQTGDVTLSTVPGKTAPPHG